MTRTTCLLLLAALALTGCGEQPTVDSVLQDSLAGDLRRYEPPSAEKVGEVGAAVRGTLEGAAAPTPGYLKMTSIDVDAREVTLFTEQHQRQGIGVYAVQLGAGAPARLVVEVPHPRADLHTEVVGPLLFRRLDADALLVAGTHRSVADVAHQRGTVFAGVDAALVGAGTVVVQVHGFDQSRHRGEVQVVLSSTEARPSRLVTRLAEALEAAGFTTCVYDGKKCRALAGTRNVQAAHARSVGAEFVHLELSADVRSDDQERQRLADTLASVLT